VRIKSVHLAREALECVITMVTGEVIVTKFGESKKSARDELEELDDSPADSYFPTNTGLPSAHKQEWIEEVTEIGHLAKWKHDGFKPVAIFTLKRGEAIACAVSDIGEASGIPVSAHHQDSLRYPLQALQWLSSTCVDLTSFSVRDSTKTASW